MRTHKYDHWYMREVQYPTVEPMTTQIQEAFDANPQLFFKTALRRELVWVGSLWPSPEEVADGIAEAHGFFTCPPDIVVIPWPTSGHKIMGVELA